MKINLKAFETGCVKCKTLKKTVIGFNSKIQACKNT